MIFHGTRRLGGFDDAHFFALDLIEAEVTLIDKHGRDKAWAHAVRLSDWKIVERWTCDGDTWSREGV